MLRRAGQTAARALRVRSPEARVWQASAGLFAAPRALHSSASVCLAGAASAPVLAPRPSPRAQLQRVNLARARGFASAAPAASADGVIEFKLADIGEGIAEVELLEWFVEPGQTIAQFDKVCQVQSDKASVEITSRYDGVITELLYKVGDMAAVGSTLIKIQSSGAVEPAAASAPAASASSSAPAASAPLNSGKVLTSPAVRRIAKERNINLSLVAGTGPQGRILKSDVLNFDPSAVSAAPAKASAASPAATPASPASSKVVAGSRTRADHVHRVGGLQRVMVQTMTAAAAVPTFIYNDEVRMDKLIEARKSIKHLLEERAKSRGDAAPVRVSFMPFFMKAMSLSLQEHPGLNALVNADCSEVVHRGAHNIGLAMDTPRGLLVPNVKNCQERSVYEIAAELNRLQALGLKGQLGPEDLADGTITLSNIGSIGGTYASPILAVPQVVIGALGKSQVLPRYDEKLQLYPASVMNVSWAADHRVVDGASIARFSNKWKDYLENPYSMVLDL